MLVQELTNYEEQEAFCLILSFLHKMDCFTKAHLAVLEKTGNCLTCQASTTNPGGYGYSKQNILDFDCQSGISKIFDKIKIKPKEIDIQCKNLSSYHSVNCLGNNNISDNVYGGTKHTLSLSFCIFKSSRENMP